VTVFVGTGASLAGNAINEAAGTIDGKPSVFVEQALSNHFSDALRLRFTGAKGLDYNKEAYVTLAYGKFNGTERLVGSVSWCCEQGPRSRGQPQGIPAGVHDGAPQRRTGGRVMGPHRHRSRVPVRPVPRIPPLPPPGPWSGARRPVR